MNHWELVALDIWWVFRWGTPAIASVMLWEFLKWEFRQEPEKGLGMGTTWFLIAVHALIYYWGVIGKGL